MTINILDKILSYASSFGTFISAIAALYAIWLTIFQRRISYKPILIIKDFYCQTSTNNFNNFDFDAPSPEKLRQIELINIGLGAAVSLKYHWKYNVRKGLQHYQSVFKEKFGKNDESFIFDDKNNNNIFKVGNTQFNYVNANQIRDIDFVLPYNSKKSNALLDIPLIHLTIPVNINFIMILNGHVNREKINGPTLVVEFQDIEGKITICEWVSNFEPHFSSHSSAGDIECEYVLRFTPSAYGWTRRRLQKIRKSYVDLINKNKINKNR